MLQTNLMQKFKNLVLMLALLFVVGLTVTQAAEPPRVIASGMVVSKTTTSITLQLGGAPVAPLAAPRTVLVNVSAQTQIYRQNGSTRTPITLSQININDTATARGFLNADGSINANVIVVSSVIPE